MHCAQRRGPTASSQLKRPIDLHHEGADRGAETSVETNSSAAIRSAINTQFAAVVSARVVQ
jgi:hypothetical protein